MTNSYNAGIGSAQWREGEERGGYAHTCATAGFNVARSLEGSAPVFRSSSTCDSSTAAVVAAEMIPDSQSNCEREREGGIRR
jgi:hypothetical protein